VFGQLDEARLIQLSDEHAPTLLGYALRLTGDRQLAEDAVQETLIRAWTHPGAFAGSGSPLGWLLTVLRNVTRDQYRASRARPREIFGEVPEITAASVDDEIDLAVESWVVAEALAGLTDSHRAVLVETFYQGRSVKQAAAVLGVPEGTVKSRTFYALRALKAALVERGVIS
jgi:RNA polymerase sigma-70 factor (ECF subfamily)